MIEIKRPIQRRESGHLTKLTLKAEQIPLALEDGLLGVNGSVTKQAVKLPCMVIAISNEVPDKDKVLLD